MRRTHLDDPSSVFLSVESHEVHRQLLKAVGEFIKTFQVLHQIQSVTIAPTHGNHYQLTHTRKL